MAADTPVGLRREKIECFNELDGQVLVVRYYSNNISHGKFHAGAHNVKKGTALLRVLRGLGW